MFIGNMLFICSFSKKCFFWTFFTKPHSFCFIMNKHFVFFQLVWIGYFFITNFTSHLRMRTPIVIVKLKLGSKKLSTWFTLKILTFFKGKYFSFFTLKPMGKVFQMLHLWKEFLFAFRSKEPKLQNKRKK